AGDDRGEAAFVELEVLLVRPDIGAVMVYEDGDVADDFDAAVVGVLAKRGPLRERGPLDELVEANLGGEAFTGFGERHRFAPAKRFGPVCPPAVAFPERHEQAEVGEPRSGERTELGELWRFGTFAKT